MPNATITTYAFTGDGTQTGVLSQLNTAMVAAGFTLLDSYTATGNENRVWQFDADPADTLYGKMIVEGGFSAAAGIRVRGFSAFNTGTDTGSNVSTTSQSTTISLTGSYILYACNHPEVRGVIMQIGTTITRFFGYKRPSTKPTSWGGSPYGFIDAALGAIYSSSALQTISSLKPGSVGAQERVSGYISNATPSDIWNSQPFLTNALICDSSNSRAIAFFSNDVIAAPTGGMTILQQFTNTATGAIYTIFDFPNAAEARLAIKTGGA